MYANSRKPMDTSWNKSGKWYNRLVGEKGHYFHEHVILPQVLKLLDLPKEKNAKILDIGSGQGILAKKIPQSVKYVGVDLSESLINFARKNNKNPNHLYYLSDATKSLPFKDCDFTHACAILSLQNMEKAENAIKEASVHLLDEGKFIIVLNHPCFRIPRQSGWGIGENKIQYRYINRYLSFMKIPISMHPGIRSSEVTWSFHQPLSYYFTHLENNGFFVKSLKEWTSDKESQGTYKKMENRARSEIPLFLCLVCVKKKI